MQKLEIKGWVLMPEKNGLQFLNQGCTFFYLNVSSQGYIELAFLFIALQWCRRKILGGGMGCHPRENFEF